MKTNAYKQHIFLSLSTKIIIIIFVVIGLCIFLFTWFSNIATPRLIHVAQLNISRYIEQVASDYKMLTNQNVDTENFLKIQKNNAGEILSIDYNMADIYKLSTGITEALQNSMISSEKIKVFPYVNSDFRVTEKNGIMLAMPLGVVSNSIFLTNLGPKVPVYVRFVGSVFAQVKTKVIDYGINNALINVYMEIRIRYEIITPVLLEEKGLEYELLIDSKIIQGKIPDWYGKTFESRSAFLEVSFP